MLLTARKLRRQPIGKFRQPDLLDHGIGGLAPFLRAHATHAQSESDIVANIQMRKQCVGLDIIAVRRSTGCEANDVLTADQYLAMGRILMTGDHAQDRCLAAARGAEEAAIGTVGNPQVDAIDDPGVAVIAFDDASQFDASVFDIQVLLIP